MSKSAKTKLVKLSTIPNGGWGSGPVKASSLMQTRDWMETAAEIYCEEGEAKALVVGAPEAPRAIGLFRPCGAMRGVRLVGAMDIGESVELLHADEAALDEIASAMVQLGVAVDLGHYPSRNSFSQRLRKAGNGRGVTLVKQMSRKAMPKLRLDEKWKDPLAQCSRSRRQQYRRKWRKAEERGPVSVEILSPTEAEMDSIFDRIVAVEAKSWKGRAGTALLHDERQAAFFRSFGKRMAAKGCLRLCFLTIGGQDAAMTFATVWDNRFWAIKVGYDESFSPVSPGEALLVELIRHSAENEYASFEFCGKDAPWTRAWAEDAMGIEALRFYPFTPCGLGRLMHDSWQMVRQLLSERLFKSSA